MNNDGASYEPLLVDFGASTTAYHVQSQKGHISDADHAQYQHKLYTVYVKANQDVSIPMQIYWPEQLNVISVFNDVETEVYSSGTDDNLVERVEIDLSRGLNTLHILTYTGIADQRSEITLDLAGIHASATPIDSSGVATEMALVPVDQPDRLAESDVELVYAHADKFPNGITLLSCGINTGDESSTYSVDFQIRSTPDDGTPTAVETVATSGSKVAEDDGTLSATAVAVDEYVYAVLPATDVDRVNVWVTYTID